MYKDDDFLTRREDVDEDMLRDLLSGDRRSDGARNGSDIQKQREWEMNTQRRGVRPMTDNDKMRGDGRKTWGIHGYPLACVFAPIQEWKNVYDNETGLSKGTVFEELYLPFLGAETNGGGCDSCENGCRRKGAGGCSDG